jgi:hypothetical protein
MLMLFTRRPKQTATPAPARSAKTATPAPAPSLIEPLESRRLLAATARLTITNLDGVPGDERAIFNRISIRNSTTPDVVHDKATLKLKNTGTATLYLGTYSLSGPWKITTSKPSSLAPGASANITLQFTATAPPAYTYNQTNGTYNPTKAGAYTGSLTISTNDPYKTKSVEQLAGWYQTKSEDSQEPSLQTIVNKISNYKTTINSSTGPFLSGSGGKKLYGEEVASSYWAASNSSAGVYVRQLAAFHTQGSTATIYWHKKGTTTTTKLFTHAKADGQTFLPHLYGSTAPAAGKFYPGTSTFGFKIDGEWSDDRKNSSSGGGHHVRFYPVRDHNGNKIANTYFMAMDYSTNGSQNYDFQDNVYVISGIKPMGN